MTIDKEKTAHLLLDKKEDEKPCLIYFYIFTCLLVEDAPCIFKNTIYHTDVVMRFK